MTTKSDFTQQIMDFRAAYLRAVARASVDLEFRQALTKHGGNPLEVLNKEFDYECPWDLTLELRDNPQKGPRLNPAKGRVMTLRYWGEAITVYIPSKPKKELAMVNGVVDEALYARLVLDALAAYYQLNPWFLRNKPSAAAQAAVAAAQAAVAAAPTSPVEVQAAPMAQVALEKAEAPSEGTASEPQTGPNKQRVVVDRDVRDPPPLFQPKWTSVDIDKERYDLGDDIEDFISLAAAIFNAVALGWENEMLWNELVLYKGEDNEQRGRTIAILKEWLGYCYPWDIDLIIQPDPSATYIPYTKDEKGRWESTTPPKLMLTLPWMSGVDPQEGTLKEDTASAAKKEVEQNQKNPGVAVMGLALYNTDGAGYPFTCG